jgi:microcin C transport system permease protein
MSEAMRAPHAGNPALPGAGRNAKPAAPVPRFLGCRVSPMTARRLRNFRANRRGVWSLYLFLALFLFTLLAEFIANDRPLVVEYDGQWYFPVLASYPETAFGGEFETEAEYRDPFVRDLIAEKGWALWPLIPFSYRTINYDLGQPAPSPPSAVNWLGTDDQARDVAARLIYGFRISILFGLTLTVCATAIGVAAGAVQGYFGGWTDLVFQRFIEIWSGMPVLYLLIIMSSIIVPGFWSLLIILLLFSWMGLVGVVRAEFLRTRNLDYVRAAKALGQPNITIMWKHVLPNATVATVTFLPFTLTAAIGALTSLDYLGFGLPPGSPSLGEMVNQGKSNLQAPWLGFTAFFSLAILLSLLVFIGEALRDAFDARKAVAAAPPGSM